MNGTGGREFGKLTWPEARELFQKDPVALLPVGATEAHGPHLPLDTDVTIARAQARRAAEMIEERGVPAFVLPPVSYTLAQFAFGFAGTITVRPTTLWNLVEDVVESLEQHGVRRLVLLSGRGEEEARRCERIVQGSGLEWTVVRASWFAQNFDEGAFLEPVLAGEVANAFCAVRPPGHHAEYDRAMGFCLFNNVAVAAHHARAVHGLTAVAVVDFDVHHGNGTQHAFENDGGFFFASSHQFPFYPGTGDVGEVGRGNVHNAPLPAAAGAQAFRAAWETRLLPALAAFKPELIIISAGFDAHHDDPLAEIHLDEDDYVWITREIMAIADSSAGGRLISSLEGGYDLAALGRSVAAHVATLMGCGGGTGSQADHPGLT